jgi:hypothetical protein
MAPASGTQRLGLMMIVLPALSRVLQSIRPHGGAVAQLGERLVRNEEVVSSILIGSTNSLSAAVRRSSIFLYK